MKDFWDGFASVAKTIIVSAAVVIGLIILVLGGIFGYCLAC